PMREIVHHGLVDIMLGMMRNSRVDRCAHTVTEVTVPAGRREGASPQSGLSRDWEDVVGADPPTGHRWLGVGGVALAVERWAGGEPGDGVADAVRQRGTATARLSPGSQGEEDLSRDDAGQLAC